MTVDHPTWESKGVVHATHDCVRDTERRSYRAQSADYSWCVPDDAFSLSRLCADASPISWYNSAED